MEHYGLGVILYSCLNKEDLDSPYYGIAKYILKNMDYIKNYSITDLASAANVSPATVSRFCKKVGLENFFELKMAINNSFFATKPQYDFFSTSSEEILEKRYLDAVAENVLILKEHLDYQILEKLVDDIHFYENISAFGAMHMENVALSLQSDLFRCKKIIDTRLSPSKQIEVLAQSNENDLILIFTFSGNYIREYLSKGFNWSKNKKPRIYVITGNPTVAKIKYIDEVLLLPSNKHDFASHPYGMNLICSLISLSYYQKYVEK